MTSIYQHALNALVLTIIKGAISCENSVGKLLEKKSI